MEVGAVWVSLSSHTRVGIQHGGGSSPYKEPMVAVLYFMLLQAFRVKEGCPLLHSHLRGPPTNSYLPRVRPPRSTRTPASSLKASGVGTVHLTYHMVSISTVRCRCGCRGGCRKRRWMWAANRHVSLACVVVVRESGSGRRNHMFRCLSKRLYSQKNEFGGCKIEIPEDVVISTPSATHHVGLLHQGPSLAFSYPSASTPPLRNVAHIPR